MKSHMKNSCQLYLSYNVHVWAEALAWKILTEAVKSSWSMTRSSITCFFLWEEEICMLIFKLALSQSDVYYFSNELSAVIVLIVLLLSLSCLPSWKSASCVIRSQIVRVFSTELHLVMWDEMLHFQFQIRPWQCWHYTVIDNYIKCSSKYVINITLEMLLSKATYIFLPHREPSGVLIQCLARGHFDMWTGEAGIKPTTLQWMSHWKKTKLEKCTRYTADLQQVCLQRLRLECLIQWMQTTIACFVYDIQWNACGHSLPYTRGHTAPDNNKNST